MSQWSIEYQILDQKIKANSLVPRSARFRNSKWIRNELVDRKVLYFGIQRTVPVVERTEFKKLASAKYKLKGSKSILEKTIQTEVAKILGKDFSFFEEANISTTQRFFIGGDGTVSYSEFHFGAGESSILRMVIERSRYRGGSARSLEEPFV